MSPEEALTHIKALAAEGRFEFAPDALTAEYNDEIQRIFQAIRAARGREAKRPIWVADGRAIGNILEDGADEICSIAGAALGIELRPDMLWEEAAAALRDMELRATDRS